MFAPFLALLSRLVLLSLRLEHNGSFPPSLSSEEEHRLLLLAREGSIDARNKLIEHNLRLVAHVIKKYYAVSGDQDDLISIGIIGLIKAIKTFDPDKNTKLATYAARCVENELFMYFRTLRRQSAEVSIYTPSDAEGDGEPRDLEDEVCFEEDVLDGIVRDRRGEVLRACIEKVLDPREKEIIFLRYGLSGLPPMPQREVARKTGISRSYVSRLEKKALSKLETELRKHSDRS
ncbi:MAG: sigma-70 family RNA polymerase sigma factor [Clostridia bacterium]|nr:sigma-70 family RNA polymerase sigma factor [Clostridia bacterium]